MGIVAETIRVSSRAGTAWGFAVMIAGILAIMAPFITGITTTMLLAILVTGAGLMIMVYSFKAGSIGKGIFQFLFGGITVVAGALMFLTPVLSMITLTGILLVYFLVDGIYGIISGLQAKPATGWVWLVVSGIASIVLAYLLWREWPVSSQYAVGILVGIRLIFTGWSMAMLGAVGESVSDEIERTMQ